MKKLAISISAALIVLGTSGTADAQWRRGGWSGGFGHGGWGGGWRGGYYGGWGHGGCWGCGGGALAAGLIGGALIGGAIASSSYGYGYGYPAYSYGYPAYSYSYPAYGYGYSAPVTYYEQGYYPAYPTYRRRVIYAPYRAYYGRHYRYGRYNYRY